RVDHGEVQPQQVRIAEAAVARDAGLVVDQRELLADEPVEQRRLADVGTADDDDLGQLAGQHAPALGPSAGPWQAKRHRAANSYRAVYQGWQAGPNQARAIAAFMTGRYLVGGLLASCALALAAATPVGARSTIENGET